MRVEGNAGVVSDYLVLRNYFRLPSRRFRGALSIDYWLACKIRVIYSGWNSDFGVSFLASLSITKFVASGDRPFLDCFVRVIGSEHFRGL